MTRAKKAICSGCGTAIVWATTSRGKTMPVDPHPDPNGNVRLFDDGLAIIVAGDDLTKYRTAKVPLHLSHFVTCPKAHEFKRKPNKKETRKK